MDTAKSDKILARLMALHPKKIDLSLGRMHSILHKLGNPEKRLPPVIHIAGTNGKGSTVAFLRAIMEAAGYRAHVYTSPHLVRFAERIRVAGKLIEEDALAGLLERVEVAAGQDPITFFEATTAAALLAFAETPADICILEVGLGGRLDATNVVDNPVAVGITPVSLDHQQFLGETVRDIAAEKAGIIKRGASLVVGPQQKVAAEVITEVAEKHGVEPSMFGEHWHADAPPSGDKMLFEDASGVWDLPMPVLTGDHQIKNAAMAVALARAQKALPITHQAAKAGIGWARWPARLQPIKGSKLNELLPEGADLWLDGGHNPAAGDIVRTFLQGVDPVERSVTLILGMMGTKDVGGYLKRLSGLVNRVIAVPIDGETGAAAPAALAAAATDIGINGVVAKDVPSALQAISDKAHPERPPFVLVAGSLYLAGHVLRQAGLLPT